jgi:hypothetical protein
MAGIYQSARTGGFQPEWSASGRSVPDSDHFEIRPLLPESGHFPLNPANPDSDEFVRSSAFISDSGYSSRNPVGQWRNLVTNDFYIIFY